MCTILRVLCRLLSVSLSAWSHLFYVTFAPFGFMDAYNPHYVPNYSDTDERYSYENQPKMMHWGLARAGRWM